MLRDWMTFRRLRAEDPDAAEAGRLMAAHQIMNDPEARARVEETFGIEACMAQYPEAYQDTRRFSGVYKFLERVRSAIPW